MLAFATYLEKTWTQYERVSEHCQTAVGLETFLSALIVGTGLCISFIIIEAHERKNRAIVHSKKQIPRTLSYFMDFTSQSVRTGWLAMSADGQSKEKRMFS